MAAGAKDLRNTTVDGRDAKDVSDTKLNDPIAREWADTGSGVNNDQKENITNQKVSGPFGGKGHGGA